MIGDYLFRQQINLQILHLEWFPGSQTDSHIVLLTNDDCLRFVIFQNCLQLFCFHIVRFPCCSQLLLQNLV